MHPALISVVLALGVFLTACGDTDSSGEACETSADCGACDVCESGECLATPGAQPECETDLDCRSLYPDDGLVCESDTCTAWCAEPAD